MSVSGSMEDDEIYDQETVVENLYYTPYYFNTIRPMLMIDDADEQVDNNIYNHFAAVRNAVMETLGVDDDTAEELIYNATSFQDPEYAPPRFQHLVPPAVGSPVESESEMGDPITPHGMSSDEADDPRGMGRLRGGANDDTYMDSVMNDARTFYSQPHTLQELRDYNRIVSRRLVTLLRGRFDEQGNLMLILGNRATRELSARNSRIRDRLRSMYAEAVRNATDNPERTLVSTPVESEGEDEYYGKGDETDEEDEEDHDLVMLVAEKILKINRHGGMTIEKQRKILKNLVKRRPNDLARAAKIYNKGVEEFNQYARGVIEGKENAGYDEFLPEMPQIDPNELNGLGRHRGGRRELPDPSTQQAPSGLSVQEMRAQHNRNVKADYEKSNPITSAIGKYGMKGVNALTDALGKYGSMVGLPSFMTEGAKGVRDYAGSGVKGGFNPDWIANHKRMFQDMSMSEIKQYLDHNFNIDTERDTFPAFFVKYFGKALFDRANARDRTGKRIRGGVKISKKDFVKEHKNLLGVLKRGKKSELLAEAKDQAEELKKVVGGGPIPDRNTLQQIATQSYQDSPANAIGSLKLVRATPTLKFYKAPDNTIVVGIRGTKPTDPDDVKADAMIGVGQLENSTRFTRDLQSLQQFQITYPPSQYDYYGVGHSLGGAILDMFLKKGLIKNGVSYNPAVQPQDFANTTLPNSRVYMESDPLYAVMGRNLAKKPETRAPRQKSWWEKAVGAIPFVGSTAAKTYDLYQSHMLDQFQGGAKAHPKFEEQLKKVGIEPSSYLKEAQRRAKDAGLPYKLLGFAGDGVHKLAIPNADGKVIRFGAVGYGDHLLWSHLEKAQKVPKGTADAKQNTFQKSHSKIKGDWRKDPFSPNSLALKVLW